MRVLFTCIGGPGHLNPLLPVSRAVADRGHEVLWATSGSLRGLVETAGFPFHQLGSSPSPAPATRGPLLVPDIQRSEEEVREGFTRLGTRARLPLVRALVSEWRPDLVVCDEFDFASMLVAEEAGLPHASVLVTATGVQIRPDVVGEPLHEIRAECGLPEDPELTMLGRHLRLSPFPPSFRAPDAWRFGTEHAFRPPMPAALSSGSPLVYFTLGTEFALESGDLFERVLAGLRDLPVRVLMTVGRHIDPAEFGPQPEHVRIARYVPQEEVLADCTLVVSHGGSGTVIGALAHGKPMVLTPMGADQPMNADRCEALGVGRTLDPVTVTPAEVRATVSEVLADPGYRRSAERLRAEMAALPGPDHAADLLEALVRCTAR
ncbi:glycosyltransferase [Saccharothrix variisporea]|uniref:MGT family glycosyltransferase n=1 Tax=Saccharothrix variisporea TaxID=543527 RepID=A0A495XH55_9PSEU|nr:glycosyltransferase [Saccharothrix variisporea]RKT73069.1 MGT family glycosyltransferase [Saccharothrix variisporea]